MPHAGHKYKTWVSVQKVNKPVKEFDAEPAVWKEVYQLRVSINTPSATEDVSSGEQVTDRLRHHVRMRWMPDIDATYRLHILGTQRFLNIEQVLDYKQQRKYLDLICVENPINVKPDPPGPEPPDYPTVPCANCTNNSGESLPGTMRKHIRVDLQGMVNSAQAGDDDYADYLNRTHEFVMDGCTGSIQNTAEFTHPVTLELEYNGGWELTITINDQVLNAPTVSTNGDCDVQTAWLPFIEIGGDYVDAAAASGLANVQGPLATMKAEPTLNPANAKITLRSAPQHLGNTVTEKLEVYKSGELAGSLTLPLFGNRADLSRWQGQEIELRYTVTEGQVTSQARATVTVAAWSVQLTVNRASPPSSTNFHSITAAIGALTPGGLIEVQGDGARYQCWNPDQEPGRIPFGPPTYPTQHCTIRGVGATKPVIDGNMGNATQNGTVLMSRGFNQVLENIDIEFGYIGALFQDLPAIDNTIRNVEVRSGRGIGIQVNGSTACTFDRCTAKNQANWGQDGVGFYVDGNATDIVAGKCLSDTNRDGYSIRKSLRTRLLDCVSTDVSRQGALILGATHCHVIGGDYRQAGATGIQNENNSVGTVIDGVKTNNNNNSSNPGEVGIWTDDSQDTLIQRCEVSNNSAGVRSGGNGCGAMDRYQSDNTIWRFNRIRNNTKLLGGQNYGGVSFGNNDGVGFYHNTVRNNGVDNAGNRGGVHSQHTSPMIPANRDISFINNIVTETLNNSQRTARVANWRGNTLPESGKLKVQLGELLTPNSRGVHPVPLDTNIWGEQAPKYVIFFHSQFTTSVSEDIVNHAVWGFGIAVNATQQGVIGVVDIYNRTTMNVFRNQQWGKCIVDLTTDGRVINEAALVSLAPTEMRLNWTQYNASSQVRMRYLAIGGDAVERVELHKIKGRTSPGRTTYPLGSGSPWEPRSLMTFSAYASSDGNHDDGHISIGVADAPTEAKPQITNEQVSFFSQHDEPTSRCSHGQTSAFIRHHNYDTVLEEATAICECNSFHVTWQKAPPVANEHFVLAVRGPSMHIGQYKQTTVDGVAVRNLGFVPSCAMMLSSQAIGEGIEANGRMAFGAWQKSPTLQQATGCLSQDGQNSSRTARFLSQTSERTLQHYNDAKALRAECFLLDAENNGELSEVWSKVVGVEARKHILFAMGDIQRTHPAPLDSMVQVDHNVYHDPNDLQYQVGSSAAMDFETYQGLMAGQNFERSSVEADPLLNETDTPHPQSPVVNKAAPLAEIKTITGSAIEINVRSMFWPGDRIVFQDNSTAIVRRVDDLTLILDRVPPAGITPTTKLRLFVPGGTPNIGAVQTKQES